MKIYYAVTPNTGIAHGYARYANEGDSKKVYDLVMELTNNHEIAADASSWCELASVGEIYESELFNIEIVED